MKFGEETFGGKNASLTDDDGLPLILQPCNLESCVGSHIWGGPRCYCPGPAVTAEQFERGYADRSGVTVEALRGRGYVVRRCYCHEDECEGWKMTR